MGMSICRWSWIPPYTPSGIHANPNTNELDPSLYYGIHDNPNSFDPNCTPNPIDKDKMFFNSSLSNTSAALTL